MEFIECLKLARELTGSTDIKELLEAARLIDLEMSTRIQPSIAIPTNTSWLTVRNASAFFPHVKINHPVNGSITFNPYPFQTQMINTIEASSNKVVVLAVGRQMGITVSKSVLALYRTMTRPNHTVLIVAPKYNSALDIMNRIHFMIETCDLPMPFVEEKNKGSIRFNNGSKIIATSASSDTFRSKMLDTVIIEDAAFIPWTIEDDFWNSLIPCMSSQGQIIMSSTPKLAEGLFYKLWSSTDSDILKIKYVWSEHPGRDAAWEAYQKSQLGAETFAREHNCEFLVKESD